jgi:hypothetical protein
VKPIALLAFLLALPALADEKPDYSRDNLVRLFAQREIDLPPRPPARVQWHLGYLEFRALGMDWRVIYLPIVAPLSGTGLNEASRLPDPFALTNTSVAGARPFVPEPSFAVKREMRRVLAMERRRSAVNASGTR